MDRNRGQLNRCPDARALLPDYVEGELGAAQARRVADHLSACEACRREEAQYRSAFGLLRAPRVMEAPGDLYAGFAAKLEHYENRARPQYARLRWVSAAACLLVLAGAGISFKRLMESKSPLLTTPPHVAAAPGITGATGASERSASVKRKPAGSVATKAPGEGAAPAQVEAAAPRPAAHRRTARLEPVRVHPVKRHPRLVVASAKDPASKDTRLRVALVRGNARDDLGAPMFRSAAAPEPNELAYGRGADAMESLPAVGAPLAETMATAPDSARPGAHPASPAPAGAAPAPTVAPNMARAAKAVTSPETRGLTMVPEVDGRIRVGDTVLTARSESGWDAEGNLRLVRVESQPW